MADLQTGDVVHLSDSQIAAYLDRPQRDAEWPGDLERPGWAETSRCEPCASMKENLRERP